MNNIPEGVPAETWAELRAALGRMTPEQRVAVFFAATAGYCEDCGYTVPDDGWCSCERAD